MKAVPQQAKDQAGDIANGARDKDQDRGSHELERLDDVDRLDEMNPEDEVDQGLRQAKRYQHRLSEMPRGHQRGKGQAGFVRIDASHGRASSVGLMSVQEVSMRPFASMGLDSPQPAI
jgi:hypothetical protein